MAPSECPKFETCNAAVCPLDPLWARTVHLSGEPTCYHLRCAGKAGADERFAGDPVYRACKIALPLVCDRFPDIARRVAAAARAGFRGDNLRSAGGPGSAADGD